MFGVTSKLGKSGDLSKKHRNRRKPLTDFFPFHLTKVLASRRQHLNCCRENNNTGGCGNGFATEFCSSQEQRNLRQQYPNTHKTFGKLVPVQLSKLLANRSKNLDGGSKDHHLSSTLDNSFTVGTHSLTTDLVKHRHRSEKIGKQHSNCSKSHIQLFAVHKTKRNQRCSKNSNSRRDLQQCTSLQLSLVSFKASSNTVKNSDKRFLETADIFNSFSEGADKLCDTDSNSTERDTIQQINNSTEIGFAEILRQGAAEFTEDFHNTAAYRFNSIPHGREKLNKLTVSKSFTNNLKGDDNAGFHLTGCFSDLRHSLMNSLKQRMKHFKIGRFEFLFDLVLQRG